MLSPAGEERGRQTVQAGRNRDREDQLLVIYDGQCRLCLAVVRRLSELPVKGQLNFVSVQSFGDEGADLQAFPGSEALGGIRKERLLSVIHVVDLQGRVSAGAEGIVRILRMLPHLSWLNTFYRIPGCAAAAERIYRFIAKRRYAWFGTVEAGCEGEVCKTYAQASDGKRKQHMNDD